MATTKSKQSVSPELDTAEQIDGFIEKLAPDVAKLTRACRKALRMQLPTAHELVWDNYNFLVFGFCTTARPSSCIVSLAVSAKGVALSFYHGVDVPDPNGLLLGEGKQNRFLRLPTATTLNEPAVAQLINSAISITTPPLPTTGKGPTVVQSVSAKQRPRRKS